MGTLTLANVRPWGDAPQDLLIRDDRIESVRPAVTGAVTGTRVEGGGLLALPGFVNAHAHVDKGWWGRPWIPNPGAGTISGRIHRERADRERYGIPSVAAATATLREFLRCGTTATRTHVDVDLGVGLRGIEVVREAAAELGGAVDVEIVAFPQDGVIRRPGVMELLDRAAAAGATSIGGIDPATIDRDPAAQLDGLFEIAQRRGVELDIHLHEPADLGAFDLELIAERTRRAGLQGRVTISHGFALGDLAGDRQSQLLDDLADAGISWTTVVPAGTAPLPWRGMLERGMPLGLGTDGVRDLWSPFGDGDVLGVALAFARLHGLLTDGDLTRAVELATTGGAGFVHRELHGLVPGARADVVLLDAENVPDALVRTPPRRLVLAGGRVVVEEGELRC